jgi:hypothetical protein
MTSISGLREAPVTRRLGSPAQNGVIKHQDNDRTHDGNEHAVEIETGHPRCAELREQKTAHHGSDDTKHDIKYQTLTLLVYNLAANETGDQS